MSSRVKDILSWIIVIGFIFGFWYFNQVAISQLWWRYYTKVFPCRSAITYSIGTIDPRFNISRSNFLASVQNAEKIWESAYDNKELFAYKETGGRMLVNLEYDTRQETTNELKKVDQVIGEQESTIGSVEQQLSMKQSAIDSQKLEYERRAADFEQRQKAYIQTVASWNRKGGAPKSVYDSLQTEKAALEAEASALNTMLDSINQQINDFNALVGERNRIATVINQHVNTYNTIGSTRGEEFTEGEYVEDTTGPHINIYEFDSTQKLVRLLAHEFGHAIGIGEHVDDPEAIMYYLNSGTSMSLSSDDLVALYQVCGAPMKSN